MVSRIVIVPAFGDVQSNKKSMLNITKEKYKLYGYKRKSGLQI